MAVILNSLIDKLLKKNAMKRAVDKVPNYNMDIFTKGNRKVTSKQAVKLLKEQGTEVTGEEAELILDFLYKIGKLVVDTYIKI
jgi:ribosomal protein L31E